MSTAAASSTDLPDRKYAVFISYRHADNKEQGRQWASWLHHTLETYEVPPDLVGRKNERGETVRKSLYPVFRDEEELPAHADLKANIQRALRNSTLLVIICSPRAVESRYVEQEISYFKELGKTDYILPLMIDGEPNVADDPAKVRAGISIDLECLPKPLRYGIPREDGSIDWALLTNHPICADARPENKPVQGWTTAAAYREELTRQRLAKPEIDRLSTAYEEQLQLATMKIIAGAIGLPLGEVTQRDKAHQLNRQKQKARVLRRWLLAVGALALLVIFGGAVAWQQKEKADLNATLARESEKVAKEQEQKVRTQLKEAARTDWINAKDFLSKDRPRDAFAYLARSCEYDPESSLASETSVFQLKNWKFPLPLVTLRHENRVWSAQFSGDGNHILTGSSDNTARVWDVLSGKLLTTLQHESALETAQFSADGSRILTASQYTARVWDALSGKLLTTLQHEGALEGAQFSADGSRILTASQHTAWVWDVLSGKLLASLQGNRPLFSVDGSRILAASEDKTTKVLEVPGGKLLATLAGQIDSWKSAQFSPDSSRIVTTSWGETAQVWEAQSGKLLATLVGHENSLNSAQFSPDSGRIVSTSDDMTARVWESQSGKLLATLQGHEDQVWSAHFSADGRRLVTSSGDHTARVWDAQSGELIATLTGHEWWVTDAQFNADGSRIVTTSQDRTARVWKTQSGKLLPMLLKHGDNVISAQFSNDHSRIVTASEDKTARVWETQTGRLLATLPHENGVRSAQFSADGKLILTASEDETPRVWEVQSGKLLATLQGNNAQFSADGRLVLTNSRDNTARVWQSQSGELLVTLQGNNAQFSADGSRIVTTWDDMRARVWDAQGGKLIATLIGHEGPVTSARFCADGSRVITASRDKTARVWDAQSGELITTLQGHEGPVTSAEFCADGSRILSGSAYEADDTVRVWDSQNGKLLATLQGPGTTRNGQPLAARKGAVGIFANLSSDGSRIVTASFNAPDAWVWDAQSSKLLGTLDGNGYAVNSAQFSADGSRILIASSDNTVRVWEAAGFMTRVPSFWPKFLKVLSHRYLNENGELADIPEGAIDDLTAQVRRDLESDHSHLADIARLFLTKSDERPFSPGSSERAFNMADCLITPEASKSDLVHAYELNPAHPLIQLAIARYEKDEARAAFLRRYSLERIAKLPPEEQAKLQQRAEDLMKKGQ